nr:C40 family peptidase [uncultured Sellimonas sp.]
MNSFLKKGLLFTSVLGVMTFTKVNADAANISLTEAQLQINVQEPFQTASEKKEDMFTIPEQKGKYENIGFCAVDSGNVLVRTNPRLESDWSGKLYPGNAVTILGPVGEWTMIQSGNVKGFVQTKEILTGEQAQKKTRQMETEALKQNREVSFSYGETKEEEAARLKKEEEARRLEAERRAREEAEKKKRQGQAVVDYASQFIGNPYVWGGTSLTNGADCSGFVQSVYAHFGFSLPRTSYAQRSAGYEVSYSQAQPGDIICYNGHVGIYAGNGKIVNAQDPAHGIGISSATYTNIVTVRRMF